MVEGRIRSYIGAVLENLDDSKLKDSKIAGLIIEYSIFLSFVIIIIGICVVLSSFDRTISNEISMRVMNDADNISFPISSIWMNVEYKEPFACQDFLKVKEISMRYNRNIIKNVDLKLYDEKMLFIESFNLDTKSGEKIGSGIGLYWTDENNTNNWVDELMTFNQYKGFPIKSFVDSYDKFEYILKYTDFENRQFVAIGKANLKYPLKCMDYATEINI